jgi:hypothetical protein
MANRAAEGAGGGGAAAVPTLPPMAEDDDEEEYDMMSSTVPSINIGPHDDDEEPVLVGATDLMSDVDKSVGECRTILLLV